MRRLLLDTHIVLWWLGGDRRLGAKTRRLIEGAACSVSAISLVEIALKCAIGRLTLPIEEALDAHLQSLGITLLSLTPQHVEAGTRLIGRHHDVFDCLLVGTALSERMAFLTRDGPLLEAALPLLGSALVEA